MKRTDRAKKTLMEYVDARDDDTIGYVMDAYLRGAITQEEGETLSYLLEKAGNTETYRRARQLVQAECPELGPSARVAKLQNELEARAVVTRGMSVANDEAWTPPGHLIT